MLNTQEKAEPKNIYSLYLFSEYFKYIEVQMIKGLWWIPRHPESKKGVKSDEMLRGAENRLIRRFPNRVTYTLLLNI